jgi:hypothetical protein
MLPRIMSSSLQTQLHLPLTAAARILSRPVFISMMKNITK